MPEDETPIGKQSDNSTPALIAKDDANEINESLESSITKLRLVGILRSGDIDRLQQFLTEHPEITAGRTLLRQAVQIAPSKTISWIISTHVDNGTLDINAADANGNTPLHLAALYGRQDIAMLLLASPHINDTIQNINGKQPVELSKYLELAESMQIARARYVEKIALAMRENLEKQDISALEELLSAPRAASLLDINGQDPDTGSTVLHEFVKKRNYDMVEFILNHGGDPFRRDMRGILPVDVAKGDDAIKKLLKSSMKSQTVITPAEKVLKGPGPSQASGDSLTSIEFAGTASEPPAGLHLVGDPPSMKGYLKKWTNFTGGYKLRWFVLENGVLSYYKRQNDTERACRGSINMRQATVHLDSSEKLRFEVVTKGGNTKFHLKANHPVETSRWVWNLSNAIQYSKDLERLKVQPIDLNSTTSLAQPPSRASSISSRFINKKVSKHLAVSDDEGPVLLTDNKFPEAGADLSLDGANNSDEDEYEEYEDENDSMLEVRSNNQQYAIEDGVRVGLDAIRDVVHTLHSQADSLTPADIGEALQAIHNGVDNLEVAVRQYSRTVDYREKLLRRQLEQAETKESLWAKNLESLQIEHEKIQEDLYKALQKRKEVYKLLKVAAVQDSENKAAGSPAGPVTLTPEMMQALSRSGTGEDDEDEDDEFFDAEETVDDADNRSFAETVSTVDPHQQHDSGTPHTEGDQTDLGKDEKSPKDPKDLTAQPEKSKEEEEVVVAETEAQRKKRELIQRQESFNGYEGRVRSKLDLNEDERPKISLWGILRNLIGKDMTKMTLPVTFNECTSLLQRYCEDFEYPDLLDNAAKAVEDPALRSLYVAAFALSSYSSTLRRVAKPFNPLLGETYEYARPDKGYRLFCEQVSHHPPIGAMYGEHPKWDYYGYSSVKPKFNGRAIDVIPAGCWYLVLRPDAGAQVEEEVYSFTKLTSTVVGIITGSPEVDNHGELVVTNHTLGYQCVVKCKKQGWRGNNAYEVRGYGKNPQGQNEWAIGGHWDKKLIAKKLSNSEDSSQAMDHIVQDTEHKGHRIVLWQVKPRKPSPFNLTSFAISLNALNEKLQPWLAPTDTRLRPDQRAMELGQFDKAFKEKDRVEEKQRAAKRQRDGEGEEWQPHWFTKAIHPDNKKEYYKPNEQYWERRKAHDLADSGDIF